MDKLKQIKDKLLKNQVVKFIISAGAGFLVDVVAYYILYHDVLGQKSYRIFNMPVSNSTLSLALSFFLGVLVNFLITHYFVFSESKLPPYKQFTRFVLVAVVGFFANLAVLKVFIKILGMYPPFARPLAALSLFFASYFVHKFFSFSLSLRHHGRKTAASSR